MSLISHKVRKTRFVQTEQYVVAVEVELVVPEEDPGEPCYEPETVAFLREVQQRAEQGDLPWLLQHGKVYAALKTV